jgi:hypothetical protein
MKLFVTAFIQVLLVTFQTWIIAKEMIELIFFIGFFISFVWSFNVKKVAFGSLKDRFIYSFGAAGGALCAMLLTKLF